MFKAKAVGAAGAIAVSVSKLAVEGVVGFVSFVLLVVETPILFIDLTPNRNTLVKTVTAELVSVFARVTPAKLMKMNGSVLVKSFVIDPPVRAVILFTPCGNSHRYPLVAVAAATADNLNTVGVPIYLAKLVIAVLSTPLFIVKAGAVGNALVKATLFAAVLQPFPFSA